MWFSSQFDTLFAQLQRPSVHRRDHRSAMVPALRGGAQRAADRRREARHLFLEGLEDRGLMAFNVLADYATGSSPFDVALVDVNADQHPDMLIATSGVSSIDVRLGNADGTFGAAQPATTGLGPRSLATGDFNGDLKIDVVTANAWDVSLLLGNGDGSFKAPQSFFLPPQLAPTNPDPTPLTQSPTSVATGDLNGDGKLDLAVAADTYFWDCPYDCFRIDNGYVNVLLGNGGGGFGAAETLHLGTGRIPSSVAIGDINGDGKGDVITGNAGDLSVLLGNGTGALGSPINSGSGYGFLSISLGDVDGDGKTDTLTQGSGVIFEKGNGDGTFTPQSVNAGITVNSAVMGDVNSDGKIDLIAAGSNNIYHCTSYGYGGLCYDGYSTSTRLASVILGNGSGGFFPPLVSEFGTVLGNDFLFDVAVSDLTGDRRPELVTIDNPRHDVIIAINDGDWNPPPAIFISDAATVVEGNSGTVNAVFTVSIVGAHSGSVSVGYSTADGMASAGADYTATSGTLTFGPGDLTARTISVPIKGDTLDEYDEQFAVNLFNPVGGQITDPQGIAIIQDDDAQPLITINDVSKNEGNRGTTSFTFTIRLSAASGKWVDVSFATADNTAKTDDGDYIATGGTMYFPPGATTQTITVFASGDTQKEANETFFVNLTGAIDGTISDSRGVGTIVNDDSGGREVNSQSKSHFASLAEALLSNYDDLPATWKRK